MMRIRSSLTKGQALAKIKGALAKSFCEPKYLSFFDFRRESRLSLPVCQVVGNEDIEQRDRKAVLKSAKVGEVTGDRKLPVRSVFTAIVGARLPKESE